MYVNEPSQVNAISANEWLYESFDPSADWLSEWLSSSNLLTQNFNLIACPHSGSLLRQGNNLHRGRAALQLDVQCPGEGLQFRRRG